MLINIHTHYLKKDVGEISVYSEYKNFNTLPDVPYVTLGIHPWYANEDWQKQVNEIERHLPNNQIIAVGETGLDRLKGALPDLQKKIFEAHISLSEKYQKPVIIHNVRMNQELIAIRKKMHSIQPWICHGFRNNLETAKMLINHGCCLSFGIPILKDKKLEEVLKNIPIEKIFFETDDLNGSVSVVYFKASQILQMDMHALEKQIQSNFEKYFNINL